MRIIALALAGTMVAGVAPGPEFQAEKTAPLHQPVSLEVNGVKADSVKKITDRLPIAPELPELAKVDVAHEPAADNRYPVAEDPMDPSMIKTHRTVLIAPIPDVPIGEVCDALAEAATEYDLPVAFLARLIWQESKFRQSAVSPVGAQGLAQFMPRIAAHYGLENPFDPVESLSASAKFLSELRDTFGNLGLAAAAYNGGSGRVQNWLARRSRLPEETRNYVKIITGHEPEKWTEASGNVELAVHLPQRAPCEGVAGLARDKDPVAMPVSLAGWVSETIRKAEEAAAAVRAAAAKAKLLARAKGSKKSQAAKVIASRSKDKTVVAANAPKAKAKAVAARKGNTKVAAKVKSKSIKVADARRGR